MKRVTKKYDQPGEYTAKIVCSKVGEEYRWSGVVRAETAGEYNLHIELEHAKSMTKSKVVVRAIARGGARVSLSGIIRIPKGVRGVDGQLELRVLLLDSRSRATVDPQLEIESDEVKAGHRASVARIDERQIEYLMGRGVKREKAEEELVEGWLGQE